MQTRISLAQLRAMDGKDIGCSDWQLLDQDRISAFADATGDHADIHVRPDSAAAQELGSTIAHGFLTLSLLPSMIYAFLPGVEGYTGLNSGLDRVRFISPVPVGSRVRGRFTLDRLKEVPTGGLALRLSATVEIEGQTRPALVAIWLNRFIQSKSA
ncbi:MaoC family dehydratase [Primorskyibacter flagellatus]|uniref:MaoC family dehydratase n=1 Tax=Primorskyibacter flagellatus TaxID=1387277 RepID=UPI000A05543C|nr:MaoC family dehydratase [Primorskyibacter flagellatus]